MLTCLAEGNYTIPNYLGSEARNLIAKMLVVNPLHRINIEEIRKDPWFKRDLPDYLRPTPEEFFDTGVDFAKLPPLRAIERGPAEKLQGELHEAVVGKLGKTMGYAEDDVQDALNKQEPSAIKDAYMIVRENQMMNSKWSASIHSNVVLPTGKLQIDCQLRRIWAGFSLSLLLLGTILICLRPRDTRPGRILRAHRSRLRARGLPAQGLRSHCRRRRRA